nr:glycosyl hydrolase [Variovorax boronicumulans]
MNPHVAAPPLPSGPITPQASPATRALYARLLAAKRSRHYIVGTNDMVWGMPETDPTPILHGTEQVFLGITERWPGFVGMEYHDPAWRNRYGAAATDLVRRAIQLAHARGSVIGLHNHPGTPVTGELSRNGISWRAPRTTPGHYSDRSGSPLTALLEGGQRELQFLAWLDRLADFLESLVDQHGRRIPVLFRPFHELCAGTWFWWNGLDRAAEMVAVWQKMVDHLRARPALDNVLYCWNVGAHRDSNFLPFWPGNDYVDVLSIDVYDNRNLATVSFDGQWTRQCFEVLKGYAALVDRPLVCSELGYEYHVQNVINDIWDVRTGKILADGYSEFSLVAIWDRPWGPHTSTPPAIRESFRRWVHSDDVLTADRMHKLDT